MAALKDDVLFLANTCQMSYSGIVLAAVVQYHSELILCLSAKVFSLPSTPFSVVKYSSAASSLKATINTSFFQETA